MRLKNIITRGALAALLAVTCSIPAHARLRYGLRLGGTFASASLDHAPGYSLDNRSGFSGGLVLEYTFLRGFAPDIAVVYSRYNTRLRPDGGEPQSFGRNFLEIPLHFKYKIPVRFLSNLINPMLYTGPALAFKMGYSHSRPLEAKTFQPRWDFGVGVDIVNFIQITGGYTLGLGNAVKHFDGAPDARLRTDGWNIAVNILFDF